MKDLRWNASDRDGETCGGGSRNAGIRAGGDGDLAEHIRALRRYGHVLTGNHADADDLVQEALKRALVYIDGRQKIDNLRAYLFTILHNVRVDALKRQRRAGVQIPVEETSMVAPDAPPSARLACREVIAAMQRLSEEHRAVLMLVGVEGLSYREASEVLGIAIGTVMSRLNRARRSLREMLEIEGDVLEAGPVS